MFFNNKDKEIIEKQREEISSLLHQRSDLSNQIYYLKKELEELKSKYDEDVETSSLGINFELMKAFSIERMKNDKGIPVTNVMYFTEDNKVKEAIYYTTQDTHNKLVKLFGEYIANKE